MDRDDWPGFHSLLTNQRKHTLSHMRIRHRKLFIIISVGALNQQKMDGGSKFEGYQMMAVGND